MASQAGDADPSRAPGLNPGSWTEPGVLECPSQFTTVTPRRWCLVFLCDIAIMFIHIFQRIALNWIHSFENWRNVWHVTIIWPIRSVTLRNKYILHSHWNWFYYGSVLCSALLTYVLKLPFGNPRVEQFSSQCPASYCAFKLFYTCWHTYNVWQMF